MPFVTANDISIYYEVHGEGEPLFIIGGFTQNTYYWLSFIPHLSKHFQVIAFDNRGAGQSESPPEGGYSIKMFAEDTAALLDTLNIESAHFLGESMGSLIIQQLCLDHRDRVKKAILCAPFAKCPPVSAHYLHMQLKLFASGVDRKDLLSLNASWLLSNTFLSSPANIEKYLEETFSNPYLAPIEGIVGQADALFEADLRKEIHQIPHEVLLLIGGMDILTPPYCAKYLQEQISNCKSHTFREMGHLFNYEIPHQSAKEALRFLLS